MSAGNDPPEQLKTHALNLVHFTNGIVSSRGENWVGFSG